MSEQPASPCAKWKLAVVASSYAASVASAARQGEGEQLRPAGSARSRKQHCAAAERQDAHRHCTKNLQYGTAL